MREPYERRIKKLQEAYGEAMAELRARKNYLLGAGAIETSYQYLTRLF